MNKSEIKIEGFNPQELMEIAFIDLIMLARKARHFGLLELEEELPGLKSEFMRKLLTLVVEDCKRENLEEIAENERRQRQSEYAELFDSLSFYLKTSCNKELCKEYLRSSLNLGSESAVNELSSFFEKLLDGRRSDSYGSVLSCMLRTYKSDMEIEAKFAIIQNCTNTLIDLSGKYIAIVITGAFSILNGEKAKVLKDKLLSFFDVYKKAEMNKKAEIVIEKMKDKDSSDMHGLFDN